MATLKLNKVKFDSLLLLLVFYFLLIGCFHWVIRKEYAFIKADLVYEFDEARFIIGLVIIVINIMAVSIIRLRDFHYAISTLILIFFVFPSGVIFTYVGDASNKIIFSHNLLFWSIILTGFFKIKLKSNRFSIIQSKKLLTIIVVIGLIPFVILFAPQLNFKNLLLIEIYETRATLDAAVDNIYTDYTYSWFNKFIIPCLLVFAIYQRDRFIVLVGSLALVFLFLCGAHKAVFVGLFVTFTLYKFDYVFKINYFITLLIGIGSIALLLAIAFNNDFLMTMSIRRALLLPAMVDTLYFDMFDSNHLYWSEVFNGLFREYPYELEHSFVIGERYLGDSTWGANNGIISDGFMNAGMLGVLINILIISLYFVILNRLDIDPRFFGLFFLFIFLILSSSLTTVMLTHGGFVLLIISFLFLKNSKTLMSTKS